MGLTREQVIWVFRTLLGRDPESEQAIADQIRDHEERADLILAVVNSAEFRGRNPT